MSATTTRIRRLEWLIVVLPIVVASIQIYLTTTSDLTRWRGGGFGMYSDPHPRVSRNLWLEGRREGATIALRLYPLDERLEVACMRNTHLKRDLLALRKVAARSRDFPSMRGTAALDRAVQDFLGEYDDVPGVTDRFPRTDVRVKMVEVAISSDYERIESRVIFDRELCAH